MTEPMSRVRSGPVPFPEAGREPCAAEEPSSASCCDGRVVKALDLKSNGVSLRRFKSCSQRELL